MSHTIKKSLAGTPQEYVVVKGNEGFRMRKLGSSQARIHIEKDAPNIDSRSRLTNPPTGVPYWAVDVNLAGLKEQIQAIEGGKAEKFVGIETVLAALTVQGDGLASERDTLRQEIRDIEKKVQSLVERKKKLDALKSRVTAGMVAYREAQDLLNEVK